MPKLEVSVVLSYFNEEDSILQTLKMLESQTYLPAQVFMVNSSSTDGSSKIVDEWIAEEPTRGTIYRNIIEHSRYPSGSMNVGIRHCETLWIAFMDCGLSFENNWLEKQAFYLGQHPEVEWVRGVGRFRGVGYIDYCATTQTYGDSRRPHNIPSSFILRSVFDRVGYFANTRAAFDLDWAGRAESNRIVKTTNDEVEVNYIGANFSRTWQGVARKGFLYSKASTSIPGYTRPLRILSICLLAILLVLVFPGLMIQFGAAYFGLRGLLIPTRKCRGFKWLKRGPLIIVPMFLVGVILDLSRFLGLIAGFHGQTIRKIRDFRIA